MQSNNPALNKNMTTLHSRKSMGSSPLRLAFILIPLALACFALSPTVWAVDPPPDGGYPGQNTAEGENALLSLTTGTSDTAIGFQALRDNTEGSLNTATGSLALGSNTTGSNNSAFGYSALGSNTTGERNTAFGQYTLGSNTTVGANTASGDSALYGNTTGVNNTATGYVALRNNISAILVLLPMPEKSASESKEHRTAPLLPVLVGPRLAAAQ